MQKYSGTLPNSIAGTSVKVSQSAASLFSVSPTRIVAQLPYTGMMQFTVTVQGQTSTMFTGSFGTAVVGVAAVYKQDLSSITQDSPAKPGDTVIAYIAGAGDTTPASVAGTPAPDSPVFNANQTFAAQVETDEPGQGHIRMMCTVKSVRMVPGLIGIAQAQVVITPEISADSINWDFSINQSNKVRIYIKSAAAP